MGGGIICDFCYESFMGVRKSLWPSRKPRSDLGATLAAVLRRFAQLVLKCGIKVNADFGFETRQIFSAKSQVEQWGIVKAFSSYCDLMDQIQESNISLIDDRQLTWKALMLLGLKPPADLLDFILDGDVVEIYNRDQIQMFRNLRFFELCSYPVADVLVRDWPSLYERTPDLSEDLLTFVGETFAGGFGVRRFPSSPHFLTERNSVEKRQFKVVEGYLAPLWSRSEPFGEVTAVLATKKVSMLK
jgi:hypothetical protein